MKPSVLVVAHDAGGANPLFYGSMAFRHRYDFHFFLAGPAKKLWINSPQAGKLLQQPVNCDCVLTGTGWQTDFERQAIAKAKAQSIPVISFVDYWANYRERFLENDGTLTLPDQIWVPDTEALQVARKELGSDLPIARVVGNLHWRSIIRQVKKLPGPITSPSLLIALEPIRLTVIDSHALYHQVTLWIKQTFPKNTIIILRPHPSGSQDEVGLLRSELESDYRVQHSSRPLANDLASSTDVLGFQSSLLPLALRCRKRAWSFFPVSDRSALLPHKNIGYIL